MMHGWGELVMFAEFAQTFVSPRKPEHDTQDELVDSGQISSRINEG